ncbi:unnamed protein product, partial [Amoebophrya sp. A120]
RFGFFDRARRRGRVFACSACSRARASACAFGGGRNPEGPRHSPGLCRPPRPPLRQAQGRAARLIHCSLPVGLLCLPGPPCAKGRAPPLPRRLLQASAAAARVAPWLLSDPRAPRPFRSLRTSDRLPPGYLARPLPDRLAYFVATNKRMRPLFGRLHLLFNSAWNRVQG